MERCYSIFEDGWMQLADILSQKLAACCLAVGHIHCFSYI